MSDGMEFGEREARKEEATYETPAVAERREFVREQLDPREDDAVLSIGCGPGFEPAELSVGDRRVCAIDRSDAMLTLARRRVPSEVTLMQGTVTDLPVADDSFDRALAVQVYEYVEDVAAAIAELHRVLRPGGRAAVYDTDFDSLVWRSSDCDRTDRVLTAWDDHCAHPHLGSGLAPYLREKGLLVDLVLPYSILETRLDRDAFSRYLMESVYDYVTGRDAIGSEEADAWVADLYETDDRGEAFFSLTQYLYLVHKPK